MDDVAVADLLRAHRRVGARDAGPDAAAARGRAANVASHRERPRWSGSAVARERVRAAVLHEVGAPLRVEDLELEPPRAGEVQVRVDAAGVCHSDHHYMTGDLRCPLPVVVGHEGAGEVEAVGAGVETRPPRATASRCSGGRAAAAAATAWRGSRCCAGSGAVQAATGGLPDDGTTRLRLDGREVHHLMGVSCFAERVVVSEKSVVPVPDGVPPRIAAITGCAVITGVGAVSNVAGECAGQALLVLGAGGVGLSAVMGARLVGAEPIVVVDVDAGQAGPRPLAGRHPRRPGRARGRRRGRARRGARRRRLGDRGGRPRGDAAAGRRLPAAGRHGGRRRHRARRRDRSRSRSTSSCRRQKRVVGSLYGSANPLVDLPRLFRLYLAGRLPLDALVGAEYPLEAVNDAYAALLGGAVGRGVLVPGDDADRAIAAYPSLRGRVAFVSGGATGLGAEFVAQLAAQGARVGFVDVQDDAGRALAEAVGGRGDPPPFFQPCDVRDIPALQAAIAACGERLGPVTVLVNNAANDRRHAVGTLGVEEWDELPGGQRPPPLLRHPGRGADDARGGRRLRHQPGLDRRPHRPARTCRSTSPRRPASRASPTRWRASSGPTGSGSTASSPAG